MSERNWLLRTKFLWSMEPNFRVLDRNVFLHLSKIVGSKLAFIVEAQQTNENLLMRDKINIYVNFIELIL